MKKLVMGIVGLLTGFCGDFAGTDPATLNKNGDSINYCT